MNEQWSESVHRAGDGLVADALPRLLNDQTAVVVLRDLLDRQEYASVVADIERRRAEATVNRYTNASLTTFGPYLARHLKDPHSYFEAAAAGNLLFAGDAPDLRAVVRHRLATALGVPPLDVAQEPDGRGYSPAIVRIHADGVSNPLHNDNIARDAVTSGLVVSRLASQFSCIVCLQECDGGGALHHYRRRWHPHDERFKVAGGLGYSTAVVSGAELCRFRPVTGDVYIIDPTNYHAIAAVQGRDRITLGFFFGFFNAAMDRGLCWS